MARTIEKEITIGTDMPEGSKWEEDEQGNTDLDCNEILGDMYKEKNEAYKVFQLARCVRELAKKYNRWHILCERYGCTERGFCSFH